MSNLTSDDLYSPGDPVIREAVRWLTACDTVLVTRRQAENLLPHWEHYGKLTGAERGEILAQFPRVVHAFTIRGGQGGFLWSCRCGWNVIALHGDDVTGRLAAHTQEI